MSADERIIEDDNLDDSDRMFGHKPANDGDGSIDIDLLPGEATSETQQNIAKAAVINRDCPSGYIPGIVAETYYSDAPWDAPAPGYVSRLLHEFDLSDGRDNATDTEVREQWADAREATDRLKMVKAYQRKGKHEQPYLVAADDDEVADYMDRTQLSSRNIAQHDPKDSIDDFVSRQSERAEESYGDEPQPIETENGNASFSGDPIDGRMQTVAERPNQGSDPKGQAAETTEESPSSEDSMDTPLDACGCDDTSEYETLDTVTERAEARGERIDSSLVGEQFPNDHDGALEDERVERVETETHQLEVHDDELVSVIRALLNDRDVPDAVAKRAIKNV